MSPELTLGKYTLLEMLGQGGFGVVYKARDPLNRLVAVKILKPSWSDDPTALERFRREAQAAGMLYHSQIATILDAGEQDGRIYLVMRYVDGPPLDRLIRENGPVPWPAALRLLEQAAGALDYAHQRGLVHRDIKPGNILVSRAEGAILTDFGLVKAVQSGTLTSTGVVMGTPNYIAPEVWKGEMVGPATDLYSLACVFYEMLTGQVLFAGDSAPQVMTRHVLNGPQFTAAWPPGTPPGVQGVLRRALSVHPAERQPSAAAFAAELAALGQPAAPRPAPPPQPYYAPPPPTAPEPIYPRRVEPAPRSISNAPPPQPYYAPPPVAPEPVYPPRADYPPQVQYAPPQIQYAPPQAQYAPPPARPAPRSWAATLPAAVLLALVFSAGWLFIDARSMSSAVYNSSSTLVVGFTLLFAGPLLALKFAGFKTRWSLLLPLAAGWILFLAVYFSIHA